MTIEQRQKAAENWADAYCELEKAADLATHYDDLRVKAEIRLTAARKVLATVAAVGSALRTRTFLLPTPMSNRNRELVKVTYNVSYTDGITAELLKTEPNE